MSMEGNRRLSVIQSNFKTVSPVLDTGNAYADGDVLFLPFEVTEMARAQNDVLRILEIQIGDWAGLQGVFDLLFFEEEPSISADINEASVLTPADLQTLRGKVAIEAADWFDGNGGYKVLKPLVDPIRLAARGSDKSIWMYGIARGAQTYPLLYASDFSADADSWSGLNGSVDGNIDTIGGEDDNLRLTLSGGSGVHYLSKASLTPVGKIFDITLDYYLPSGNTSVDGLRVTDIFGNPIDAALNVTQDAWTTITISNWTSNGNQIRVYAYDGTSQTVDEDGDLIYIRNVTVDRKYDLDITLVSARE